METIEVLYAPIPPTLTKQHKYIVYTDRHGRKWAARGGPGNHNILSPMGRDLVTQSGRYEEGMVPDWAPPGKYEAESIAEGDDLSGEWQSIVAAMEEIKQTQYPYHLLHQNSNTAVD